jgi:hypothetical protein
MRINLIYFKAMSNNKQGSIEWVEQQFQIIIEKNNIELEKIWQQLKAMHKEEIVKAFDEGQECEYQYHINSAPKYDSETFYNETYGGQDES